MKFFSRKKIFCFTTKNDFVRVQKIFSTRTKKHPFLGDFKEQMDAYSRMAGLSYLYDR